MTLRPVQMVGVAFIVIGLAVFGIRLIHAGDYSMPQGGGLYGGLAAIMLGLFLIWTEKPRPLVWVALAISPVALFPAIYSIMGESEEVISLYAVDSQGGMVDLRLWVVDREDGAWVGMGREKAQTHSLHGRRMKMLRAGEELCVMPMLHEDRPTVTTIHAMKVEKYAVARMAGAIGLYPLEVTESTVVLRLDPCTNR